MARKKRARTCAYCGHATSDWTDDHVIPDCFWDDHPLPNAVVTVRACGTCNGYWSLDEGYFRSTLAMMSENGHEIVAPMVAGAVQRHLMKDAKFRRQITSSTRITPTFTEVGVFSGMRPTFELDWQKWDTVVGKMVRGMVYHDLQTPLPRDYVVQSWHGNGFWSDVTARAVIDQMPDQWSGMGTNGIDDIPDDVFLGKRGYSVEDPFRRVFLLLFFRSVAVLAWTSPVAEAEAPDPSHPDYVSIAVAERLRRKRRGADERPKT